MIRSDGLPSVPYVVFPFVGWTDCRPRLKCFWFYLTELIIVARHACNTAIVAMDATLTLAEFRPLSSNKLPGPSRCQIQRLLTSVQDTELQLQIDLRCEKCKSELRTAQSKRSVVTCRCPVCKYKFRMRISGADELDISL
jgi:Zn finger protein HypA/HybF involved in hydrogenase expression